MRLMKRAAAAALAVAMLISAVPVMAQKTDPRAAELSKTYQAWALLGEKPVADDMKIWMAEKNEPETLTVGDRGVWIMDPSAGTDSQYIYAALDDKIKSFQTGSNVEVTIEYFDEGISSLTLEYPQYTGLTNGNSVRVYNKTDNLHERTELDYLEFQDSKTWKTHTWLLQRPALNKGLGKGDFRIGLQSDTMGTSLGGKIQISAIYVRFTNETSIVNMDISSADFGNNFFTDEKMEMTCTFEGVDNTRAGRKIPMDVEYTLINDEGDVVDTVTSKVTVSGKGKVTDTFVVEPNEYSLYFLKVTAKNEKLKLYSEYTERCAYIRSTKGEIQNPKHSTTYGTINNHEMNEHNMKMMLYAGFSGVRFSTNPDELTLSSYDKLTPSEIDIRMTFPETVALAKKYNLWTWIFSGGASGNGSPIPYIAADGTAVPKTDEDRQRLWNTDKAILDAFGNGLDVFQVSNEMDLRTPVGPDWNMKAYADYCNYVIPKIREKYPDMDILVGETSGLRTGRWTEFLNNGGADNADILGFHIYTWAYSPIPATPKSADWDVAQLAWLHKQLEERGLEDKKLWLTEYGYSAFYDACKSEYQQGCWNVASYLMYEQWLDQLTYFQTSNKNIDWRGEREDNFGITRSYTAKKNQGAAKDSMLQISNMNIEMYDAEHVSRTDVGGDTVVMRYHKKNTNEDMLIPFSDGPSETLTFDLGTDNLTYIDTYGNEHKLVSENGIYSFSVSPEPFYIKGNFKKCELIEDASPADVSFDAMLKSVTYNDKVEFNLSNKTGKPLEVEAEMLDSSLVKLSENTGLSGESGKLVFELGSTAPKGIEPIKVTVKGEDGIYFKGNIYLEYNESIVLDFESKIGEDKKWYLETTIHNNASLKDISGTLELTSPSNWVGKVPSQKLTIKASETLTVDIPIECRGDSESKVLAGMTFTTDSGQISATNKNITFAYAPNAAGQVKIDGDISEWTDGWMYLDQQQQWMSVLSFAGQYRGRDDLWAKAAVKWDKDYFYFAGEVHDDAFFAQDVETNALWSIDGIQIGLVYDPEGKLPNGTFEELAFALLDGKPEIYRHKTGMKLEDATAVEGAEMAFKNEGNVTYYEMRVPWTSLISGYGDSVVMEPGKELEIEIVINENDGPGRKGYYMLAGGVAESKDSSRFAKLYIAD